MSEARNGIVSFKTIILSLLYRFVLWTNKSISEKGKVFDHDGNTFPLVHVLMIFCVGFPAYALFCFRFKDVFFQVSRRTLTTFIVLTFRRISSGSAPSQRMFCSQRHFVAPCLSKA